MRARLCGLVMALAFGALLVSADDEPPKTVKPDPLVTKLEKVQTELLEATALVTSLQRRLRACDTERTDAQARLVLLRDDNLRLADELDAVRKGS